MSVNKILRLITFNNNDAFQSKNTILKFSNKKKASQYDAHYPLVHPCVLQPPNVKHVGGGGGGPQVNKSEQVSNLGHQMLLAGGPSMAGWETGASPCMVGAL